MRGVSAGICVNCVVDGRVVEQGTERRQHGNDIGAALVERAADDASDFVEQQAEHHHPGSEGQLTELQDAKDQTAKVIEDGDVLWIADQVV